MLEQERILETVLACRSTSIIVETFVSKNNQYYTEEIVFAIYFNAPIQTLAFTLFV